MSKRLIGGAALVVGIGAVGSSIMSATTPVGGGLTIGFGAFIAFFALLSMFARNRTPDYWGLFVTGFAMFLLPWLGAGFTPDRGAAWTAGVAGFLAMTLGAIGWTRGTPPTASGINEYGSRTTRPGAIARRISRTTLAVGLVTVVLGATALAHAPVAAVAVTVGLGGLMSVIALWAMLADDPTLDYLKLAVVAFALFLAPWAAGFAGDDAAWAAWISGAIVTSLAVTGYLRGDSRDFAATVREGAAARYRERFAATGGSATTPPPVQETVK